MVRTCQPELLDHLPVDDPGARQSRNDLRRVNAWMGNARLMARTLKSLLPGRQGQRILEIGAGDGTFFLELAKRVGKGPASARAIVFLDRLALVNSGTRAELQKLGWSAETICADVFEYFSGHGQTSLTAPPYDAMLAN